MNCYSMHLAGKRIGRGTGKETGNRKSSDLSRIQMEIQQLCKRMCLSVLFRLHIQSGHISGHTYHIFCSYIQRFAVIFIAVSIS